MPTQSQRVDVSMVPLKWSTVISTLLPGALALFAVSGFIKPLNDRVEKFENIGTILGIGDNGVRIVRRSPWCVYAIGLGEILAPTPLPTP